MRITRGLTRGLGPCAAAVLLLPVSVSAQGSSSGADGPASAHELVGVSVDIEDGESIGADCVWYSRSPRNPAPARDACVVTRETIEAAGVPTLDSHDESEDSEADVRLMDSDAIGAEAVAGDLGSGRYRLVGRVTALHFEPAQRATIIDTGFRTPVPVEPMVTTDGRVMRQRTPPRTVGNRMRVPARPPHVSTTVLWTLYDAATGRVVTTREVEGGARYLGESLHDSYAKFLDRI